MKIVTSKIFLKHYAPGHIERPKRVKVILELLKRLNIDYEKPYPLSKGVYRYLHLAHSWKYIREIKKIFEEAYREGKVIYVDGDTYVSPLTWIASFKAVLAGIKSVDMIKENVDDKVFVAVRPPGHHAGIDGRAKTISQGFCIFNNVAIAALYARKKDFKNIVILDIDLHHGNGTEEIVHNKKGITYISIHSTKIYPGTGYESYDNIINYPLEPGIGNKEYLETLDKVFENIEEINPDLVLVSLGFDAHKSDPLSTFNIDFEPYKRVFDFLKNYKTIYVLEGGYNTKVIEKGVMILISSNSN